eukprot:7179733-Prymnesium_polylepis.1
MGARCVCGRGSGLLGVRRQDGQRGGRVPSSVVDGCQPNSGRVRASVAGADRLRGETSCIPAGPREFRSLLFNK